MDKVLNSEMKSLSKKYSVDGLPGHAVKCILGEKARTNVNQKKIGAALEEGTLLKVNLIMMEDYYYKVEIKWIWLLNLQNAIKWTLLNAQKNGIYIF